MSKQESTPAEPCISTPGGGFVQISIVARMTLHSHGGQYILNLWTSGQQQLGLHEFTDEIEAIAFANQFRAAKGLDTIKAPAVNITGA